MKTAFFAFCNVFIALLLFSCGPTPKEATVYNDKVVDQQLAVVASYDDFITAINDTSVAPDVYKQKLKALSSQIQIANNKLKGLEKFDDSTVFADACLKLFSVFDDVTKNEFVQVITIYDKEEYTEEDATNIDAIFTSSNSKVEKALNVFTQAQKDFAAKYNFKIQE